MSRHNAQEPLLCRDCSELIGYVPESDELSMLLAKLGDAQCVPCAETESEIDDEFDDGR